MRTRKPKRIYRSSTKSKPWILAEPKLKFASKRICENEWHGEVILDKFERCPICGSESYHKVVNGIESVKK